MICDTEKLTPDQPEIPEALHVLRVEGSIGVPSNLRRAYLWHADRSMLSRSQAWARCTRFHHVGRQPMVDKRAKRED